MKCGSSAIPVNRLKLLSLRLKMDLELDPQIGGGQEAFGGELCQIQIWACAHAENQSLHAPKPS